MGKQLRIIGTFELKMAYTRRSPAIGALSKKGTRCRFPLVKSADTILWIRDPKR